MKICKSVGLKRGRDTEGLVRSTETAVEPIAARPASFSETDRPEN